MHVSSSWKLIIYTDIMNTIILISIKWCQRTQGSSSYSSEQAKLNGMHPAHFQSLVALCQLHHTSFHYPLTNLQGLPQCSSLLSLSSSLLALFFISSLSAHPFVCLFLSSAMQAEQFFTSLGKQV